MRSPLRIYREWKWRRDVAWEWAWRMNAAINALPLEQQDQLDAQLRDRLAP